MSHQLITNIWKGKQVLQEIKKIYGKNLTETEFITLCQIGKATGLNPFLREIWAVKYGNDSASIFIGRDGYRKSAQNDSDYEYHKVDAVYQNDKFLKTKNGFEHEYTLQNRGKLLGAYAEVKRRSTDKITPVFVDLEEYYKGHKDEEGNIKQRYDAKQKKYVPMKKTIWDEKPATMIKKVAEAQALRMAFQNRFAGTYSEAENWHEGEHIEPAKTLPEPELVVSIKTETAEFLQEGWSEMWRLSAEKLPNEKNSDGKKKFTKSKAEQTCKATLQKLYDKSEVGYLTEEEGKDFAKRCHKKIKELKKLPNPTKRGKAKLEVGKPTRSK